ncbi:uncharacterized protein BX664DRAFT_368725 [Halteromyces radiatus]|uniref:uncharacterized protein n=1 Tax=Halteromyces radiatus TaxID=101107 RepID=UPI00222084FC|nr:uncharacterized protein BX664DRAFT_368725 [Halteromyces radiatus]KAI8099866.1 hypothetical protein BX664DRAFT_368725 [Halteromyces radiatus]
MKLLLYLLSLFVLTIATTSASSKINVRALGEPEPYPEDTLPGALASMPIDGAVTIYFDPYGVDYWNNETNVCLSWIIGLPKNNSTDNQCNFDESNECLKTLTSNPCQQAVQAPSDKCKNQLQLISGFARINSYYPSVTPLSSFNTTLSIQGFWEDKSIMMAYSSKKKDSQVNQRTLTCGNLRLGHGSIGDFKFDDEQPAESSAHLKTTRTLYFVYALFIILFLF